MGGEELWPSAPIARLEQVMRENGITDLVRVSEHFADQSNALQPRGGGGTSAAVGRRMRSIGLAVMVFGLPGPLLMFGGQNADDASTTFMVVAFLSVGLSALGLMVAGVGQVLLSRVRDDSVFLVVGDSAWYVIEPAARTASKLSPRATLQRVDDGLESVDGVHRRAGPSREAAPRTVIDVGAAPASMASSVVGAAADPSGFRLVFTHDRTQLLVEGDDPVTLSRGASFMADELGSGRNSSTLVTVVDHHQRWSGALPTAGSELIKLRAAWTARSLLSIPPLPPPAKGPGPHMAW